MGKRAGMRVKIGTVMVSRVISWNAKWMICTLMLADAQDDCARFGY